MIQTIHKENILFQKTKEFDFELDAKDLAAQLIQEMTDAGGLGLAANQIGIPFSVFAMKWYHENGEDANVVVFNPIITPINSDTEEALEGCLSYPKLFLPVIRLKETMVEFYDFNKKKHNYKLTGLNARIFQHEYDHLQGKVFYENCSRLKVKMAARKANKSLKKYPAFLYTMEMLNSLK